MLRIKLEPKKKLSKAEIDDFKKDNPDVKFRFQKDGTIFMYIRAYSSEVERCSDIAKAVGAIPTTPTTLC